MFSVSKYTPMGCAGCIVFKAAICVMQSEKFRAKREMLAQIIKSIFWSLENESASTVQNQICRRKPSPQKSTVAVNTLSVSKMEQKSLAFLFLSKLPTPYPFPRMSFCSTVLNILLPLQTPNFTACCWTVMKLNRLSLFAWQKS